MFNLQARLLYVPFSEYEMNPLRWIGQKLWDFYCWLHQYKRKWERVKEAWRK